MEEKERLHRMLASIQAGLHDQLNAFKSELETMLELSATLEDKTTSLEELKEIVPAIYNKMSFQLQKAQNLAYMNSQAISISIGTSILLDLSSGKKRGGYLKLLFNLLNIVSETRFEVVKAKNYSSLEDLMGEFSTQANNIIDESMAL